MYPSVENSTTGIAIFPTNQGSALIETKAKWLDRLFIPWML